MSKYNIRELDNTDNFEPASMYESTPFTQANFYGDWQKYLGRKVKRFLVEEAGAPVAYFQVIKYPLIFGKSYFYIPYGPIVKKVTQDLLNFIKNELIKEANLEDVVFTRLDFTPVIPSAVLSKMFVKSPVYTYQSAYFQPRSDWSLNLGGTEDELIMAMHEKTRYSIRLSERKGIVAEIVTDNFMKYFETFYELMLDTAQRNKFSQHPRDYYLQVFENLNKTKSYLSVASYNGKILAIYVIIVYGKVANYIWGGSSNEERNRMPTYLAHWKAILYAKTLGCDEYNFGGISPSGYKIYKKEMDSLTVFKKKFNGTELVHSELFDIVTKPFWYHLYNIRKRIKTLGR